MVGEESTGEIEMLAWFEDEDQKPPGLSKVIKAFQRGRRDPSKHIDEGHPKYACQRL